MNTVTRDERDVLLILTRCLPYPLPKNMPSQPPTVSCEIHVMGRVFRCHRICRKISSPCGTIHLKASPIVFETIGLDGWRATFDSLVIPCDVNPCDQTPIRVRFEGDPDVFRRDLVLLKVAGLTDAERAA